MGNMWQACFLNLPGFSKDQQIDVVSCINGDGHAFDSGAVNDATLRVGLLNIHNLKSEMMSFIKSMQLHHHISIKQLFFHSV